MGPWLVKRERKMRFDHNPLNKPPREVWDQGHKAVADYLQQLENGTMPVTCQLRISMLGCVKAGKSSISRALSGIWHLEANFLYMV